jgi:hypothetical protein
MTSVRDRADGALGQVQAELHCFCISVGHSEIDFRLRGPLECSIIVITGSR